MGKSKENFRQYQEQYAHEQKAMLVHHKAQMLSEQEQEELYQKREQYDKLKKEFDEWTAKRNDSASRISTEKTPEGIIKACDDNAAAIANLQIIGMKLRAIYNT